MHPAQSIEFAHSVGHGAAQKMEPAPQRSVAALMEHFLVIEQWALAHSAHAAPVGHAVGHASPHAAPVAHSSAPALFEHMPVGEHCAPMHPGHPCPAVHPEGHAEPQAIADAPQYSMLPNLEHFLDSLGTPLSGEQNPSWHPSAQACPVWQTVGQGMPQSTRSVHLSATESFEHLLVGEQNPP